MTSPQRGVAAADDARFRQLTEWLRALFGASDFEVAPASADASFRRYFRVTRGAQTWIAMDAPPDKEDMQPYIRIAGMLVDVGVNAPRVLEQNLEAGFLLNTDLGSRTYLAALDSGADPDRLYTDAIAALVRLQVHGQTHARSLPPYDEALLRREMHLFSDWFCGRHLQIELQSPELGVLHEVFDTLAAAALQQPRVFVHRDYHSRNLMVSEEERYGPNPGVLDFQDAVEGPVTYDLVSLLRDCYIAWPLARVHTWVEEFRGAARLQGGPVAASAEQFMRWFDLMGVQRHLKAIGIFARLWRRDGKPGYLGDIPRTLNYVQAVCQHYPELKLLQAFIEERVAPAMVKHPAPVRSSTFHS